MAIKIIVLFFNFLFLNYLLHMYMGSFPVIIKSPSQFIKEFGDSKHSPTVTGFLFANPLLPRYFQLVEHRVKTRWHTRIVASISHLQSPCASNNTVFHLKNSTYQVQQHVGKEILYLGLLTSMLGSTLYFKKLS